MPKSFLSNLTLMRIIAFHTVNVLTKLNLFFLSLFENSIIFADEFKKFTVNKPEFATVFLAISGVPVASMMYDSSIDSMCPSIRDSIVSEVYEASTKTVEHVSLLLGNETDQCHTTTKPFNLSLQCNNMSLNVC